jgi:hypothetical protein
MQKRTKGYLGMIFGVVKEISGIRAAAQLTQAEREK